MSRYSASLLFGLNNNATVGFDASTGDILVPPPPPTGLYAYFWHPDNPSDVVDFTKLSTSLLPVKYPVEWTFQVKTIRIYGESTVTWRRDDIMKMPENYLVILETPRDSVDMRATEEYSWDSESDFRYTFKIRVSSRV